MREEIGLANVPPEVTRGLAFLPLFREPFGEVGQELCLVDMSLSPSASDSAESELPVSCVEDRECFTSDEGSFTESPRFRDLFRCGDLVDGEQCSSL